MVSAPFILNTAAVVIKSINSPFVPGADTLNGVTAPLSVPHLFWRASAAAAVTPHDVPTHFDCLIDDGSDLVLIRDLLVRDLSLRRHKLPKPIETEVAMREGDRKSVLFLYEFVKLRLYDASGEYSAKSVRAVIAPNLVAPVILGLTIQL